MRSQLYIKTLKTPISSLPKGINTCPKAHSFTYLTGIGKKGAFKIYSYFDEAGSLIKRDRFFKKGKNESRETSYYGKRDDKNIIRTYLYIKDKFKKFISKEYDSKSLIEYEISSDKDYEKHRIVRLRAGEKPQELQYRTKWDGRAPKIRYKNVPNFLTGMRGQHYLPVIVNPDSTRRLYHMHDNQATSSGIKDVIKKLQIITRKKANRDFQNIKELEKELIVSGFSNPNGEIFIIDDIKNILDEAEIIAHEDQHLKDFSDMCRLDFNAPFAGNRFECKSVRKGIFTEENSPRKYKRLKKLHATFDPDKYQEGCLEGHHDDLDIEKSAIKKGVKEAAKLMKIKNKIDQFLYG